MTTAPRILLVEADGAVRASLKFALELEGCAVEIAESADDLLQGRALPADGCLVIGQTLRGTDGLSMLAELRQRGCRLPAVITATNPDRSMRHAVVQFDAALIEKPLLDDALFDLLRTLVQPPMEARLT